MVVVTAWSYMGLSVSMQNYKYFFWIITKTFTCFYIFDFGIWATPCYVMDRKKFFVIGAAGSKLCLPWALLLRLVCFLFQCWSENFSIMPIAITSSPNDHQNGNLLLQGGMTHSICPNAHIATLTPGIIGGTKVTATDSQFSPFSSPTGSNMDSYARSDMRPFEVDMSPCSSESAASLHCFNTHNPPILNLSPNLSPVSEGQIGLANFESREVHIAQGNVLTNDFLWISVFRGGF